MTKSAFRDALNKALAAHNMEARESDVDFYFRNQFTVKAAVEHMVKYYA